MRAYEIAHSFSAEVELSDEDRKDIVGTAIAQADTMDQSAPHGFLFSIDQKGKTWKVAVYPAQRYAKLMSLEEWTRAGLPDKLTRS
jgi:hypothetical protein